MTIRSIRTAVDTARSAAASADAALYTVVARSTGSSGLDEGLSRLSNAADHSKISLAIAALLAARPGAPRRGALRGLAAIGLTSASANLLGKRLFGRRRPDWDAIGVPLRRRVRMPSSTAFPSGHSASAAAFAVAVASEVPAAALPLGALAAVVGYSRVHTGVHYPGDVVAGFALGAACAAAVIVLDRRRREPAASAGEAAPGS
ncbi:membrane-associated phospholipid phosphatase [Catenulispora sp. GP43]|uniref:phosphatase PAP2 family protein n=1 Tax=Catenulispora sp. GP43 TaxID=3156263 RepID=UPI0035183EEC